MKLVQSPGGRAILDFDVECRPLSYWFGDVTTAEITAIGWSWDDPNKVESRVLGDVSREEMLAEFADVFAQADLVTGHYIRKFDLPLINAMLFEARLPTLPRKRTSDTKLDLKPFKHFPSSQEVLGLVLELEAPKVQMDTVKWRAANRLEQIALSKERVEGDVVQHIALRASLLEAGMLSEPRMWG